RGRSPALQGSAQPCSSRTIPPRGQLCTLSTLTALSVVSENKLRLCHDRDEFTIRRCDARLPHHRSPPADAITGRPQPWNGHNELNGGVLGDIRKGIGA